MTTLDRATTSAIRIATLVSAVMIAFQVAGRATRDALYLSNFAVTTLPLMLAASAAVSLATAVLASWAMGRYGPSRLVPPLFTLSAALMVGEWALIGSAPRPITVAVYLHFSSMGALLVSGFWSLINERFDPRTAKRVIGKIGAAANIGAVAGGLLAERVASLLSTTAMLPLLAALHVACALLVLRIGTPAGRADVPEAPAGAFRTLKASQYLQTLVAVVLLVTISEGLLEYVFKAAAKDTYHGGTPLLRMFALFYMMTSVLGAALGAALGRRTLEKLGLARTVGILPWSVVGGGIAALASPGLPAAMFAKGGETVVRGSLYRSGYELLFTPLPPGEKRSVKALLDVGAVRIGDLLAAGVIQLALVAAALHAPALMLVLAVACSGAGIMLTLAIHRGYVSTLERNLLNRAVQLEMNEIKDSTTRFSLTRTMAVLSGVMPDPRLVPALAAPPPPMDPVSARLAELRSRDAGRVRAALRAGPLEPEHVASTIRLLAWDDVARAAIEALVEAAPRHTGQYVDALLNPATDFAVRRRITGPLARAASARALDGLLAGLDDARFEVRFRCGRALLKLHADAPGIPVDSGRVFAAVLREADVERAVWESRRLLEPQDDDPLAVGAEVRQRASRSLEHVFTLLSLVLPRQPLRLAFRGLQTDDPQMRGTALEYLETALPPVVREKLWPFVGDTPA